MFFTVSFTCQGPTRIADGTQLREAVKDLLFCDEDGKWHCPDNLMAVGVNWCLLPPSPISFLGMALLHSFCCCICALLLLIFLLGGVVLLMATLLGFVFHS